MTEAKILNLTQALLEAIQKADWEAYEELCDPEMTCFEPETRGHLVQWLEFHRCYFDQGGHMGNGASTIVTPKVWLVGDAGAIIAYTRLVQKVGDRGQALTLSFQETRIWRRSAGGWKQVHFHRSPDLTEGG